MPICGIELSEPEVEPREDGLYVRVRVVEGDEFRVGALAVTGDATIDLEGLRKKLQLEEGAIFNRSFLTVDVEGLTTFYTDRGFYFARVTPATLMHRDSLTVDVEFQVEKGPLYFIREIEIAGNTRTVDPADYNRTALDRQLARLDAAGVRVVYVTLPGRVPTPHAYRLRSEGFERPLLLFNDPAEHAALYDIDLRVDTEHLNLAGALEFSRTFARELEPIIRKE